MNIGDPVNDNASSDPLVFIITGRVHRREDGAGTQVHILLRAADDDSAARLALNALAQQGYERAELDKIGTVDTMPDEEPHASAYQGALEGEVSIVTFD